MSESILGRLGPGGVGAGGAASWNGAALNEDEVKRFSTAGRAVIGHSLRWPRGLDSGVLA